MPKLTSIFGKPSLTSPISYTQINPDTSKMITDTSSKTFESSFKLITSTVFYTQSPTADQVASFKPTSISKTTMVPKLATSKQSSANSKATESKNTKSSIYSTQNQELSTSESVAYFAGSFQSSMSSNIATLEAKSESSHSSMSSNRETIETTSVSSQSSMSSNRVTLQIKSESSTRSVSKTSLPSSTTIKTPTTIISHISSIKSTAKLSPTATTSKDQRSSTFRATSNQVENNSNKPQEELITNLKDKYITYNNIFICSEVSVQLLEIIKRNQMTSDIYLKTIQLLQSQV